MGDLIAVCGEREFQNGESGRPYTTYAILETSGTHACICASTHERRILRPISSSHARNSPFMQTHISLVDSALPAEPDWRRIRNACTPPASLPNPMTPSKSGAVSVNPMLNYFPRAQFVSTVAVRCAVTAPSPPSRIPSPVSYPTSRTAMCEPHPSDSCRDPRLPPVPVASPTGPRVPRPAVEVPLIGYRWHAHDHPPAPIRSRLGKGSSAPRRSLLLSRVLSNGCWGYMARLFPEPLASDGRVLRAGCFDLVRAFW